MSRPNILILDGGMSRELMRLNAPFRQPEWSALALLEAPHLVQQAHSDYAAAGADILTTNSYAVVPFHIGAERFQKRGQELAALSGRLARNAADQEMERSGRKVLVAGSLPPIFGSYEPHLFDASTVQEYLDVLVRGLAPYVDVWLGETLSLVAEGEAVRTAVKESGKPFWISFTIDDRKHGSTTHPHQMSARLRSGESVTEAAQWAIDSGADGFLFNCSQPEFMVAAIRDAKATFVQQHRTIPIGVYANAFGPKPASQPANEGSIPLRPELTKDSYLDFARDWISEGATIIGGCCGIGCGHIQQLANNFA